jgi:hypothetical protein
MSPHVVSLPAGENRIDRMYVDAEARWMSIDLLVQLVGQVKHQKVAAISPPPQRATKLEIHMDEASAVSLAANILDMTVALGWPLPQLAGYRFAKP